MAADGNYSLNSQFLITLKEAPILNNYHIAFGAVIDGFKTLNRIESLIEDGLKDYQYLYISNCGPSDMKKTTDAGKNMPS